jgi:beta-xylosidase
LSSTRRKVTARASQEASARVEFRRVKTRREKAARDLAAARLLATRASLGVQSVRTCADGVGRATLESHADDHAAAIAALQHAHAACTRVLSAEGARAVYPFDFADPSLLRVGDRYYAYSTNNAAGDIQVITSTDLHHWALVGDALPALPRWAAPGATWAPAVAFLGGRYVAYYTVREASTGSQCVSVAVGREPAGPFTDLSTGPLVCQRELHGSIDPRPFIDASGRPWLLWSSIGGRMPALVWSQALTPDGRALSGAAHVLIKADQAWEKGVVEAPSLVDVGGTLVLFYAGNRWSTAEYGVGQARCTSPGGPCLKPGREPVFATHDAIVGPGSPDFVTTPSGELWMAVAGYRPGHVGYPASRLLHVAQVHVSGTKVTFDG